MNYEKSYLQGEDQDFQYVSENTTIHYDFITDASSWGLFIFVFAVFSLKCIDVCKSYMSTDNHRNIIEITYQPPIILKDFYLKDKNETCAICIEDMCVNEKLKILKCNHYYHEDCIYKWITKKNICPLCRSTDIISNVYV